MSDKYGTFEECPECGEMMMPEGSYYGEHSWKCKCGKEIILK